MYAERLTGRGKSGMLVLWILDLEAIEKMTWQSGITQRVVSARGDQRTKVLYII
jgi:hypothetical protein